MSDAALPLDDNEYLGAVNHTSMRESAGSTVSLRDLLDAIGPEDLAMQENVEQYIQGGSDGGPMWVLGDRCPDGAQPGVWAATQAAPVVANVVAPTRCTGWRCRTWIKRGRS